MKNGLTGLVFQLVRPVLLLSALMFSGCSEREVITERNFAGKWKSSKLATPIYLYASGEWEIRTDEGGVLQYGVWQYSDRKLIWSFKIDSRIGHDLNPVLSVSPREFRIQESDRTTTIFTRLD